MIDAGGIPFHVSAHLPFGTGIGVKAAPLAVLWLVQHLIGLLQIEVLVPVTQTAFYLGNHGILVPGLQAHKEAVLQPHHPQGVVALAGVDVEHSVVEVGQGVGNVVYVLFGVGGEFRGRADEPGGHVGVQGIGRHPGGVPAVLEFLDELEGDAVALVVEEGEFLVAVGGSCQVHLDFTHVHHGISDPFGILHAAAFLAGNLIIDKAAVRQIFLARIVAGHKVAAVLHFLVLEGSGAAPAVHLQGNVERGEDVLGGEDAVIVGSGSFAVEQVTGVLQLGVGRFGVELREVLGGVGPAFYRLVEVDAALLVPAEVVERLHRGTGHAQPGGAHILAHERVVVVVVVGGGVPLEHFYAVVEPVVPPGYQALVVQGIGQESRFQDARRVLADAVLDVLEAVLALEDGVLPMLDDGQLVVFEVVALALGLGQTGIPAVEFFGGHKGRIGQIQRVDARPQQAVALFLEGVYHDAVGEGVLYGHVPLVQERV